LEAGLVNKWNPWLPENKRIGARPCVPHSSLAPPLLYTGVRGVRVPKQTIAEATNGKLVSTRDTPENRSDQRLQIATLIGSLSRSVALLTADIEHEEARAGVRDVSDPAYPVLARSLRRRRENIKETIVLLAALAQGTPKAA
jgi:hypothetical protein